MIFVSRNTAAWVQFQPGAMQHELHFDALLSAATQALDGLSPPRRLSLSSIDGRLRDGDAEPAAESDDDMEHEEAMLRYSAEKLRQVLRRGGHGPSPGASPDGVRRTRVTLPADQSRDATSSPTPDLPASASPNRLHECHEAVKQSGSCVKTLLWQEEDRDEGETGAGERGAWCETMVEHSGNSCWTGAHKLHVPTAAGSSQKAEFESEAVETPGSHAPPPLHAACSEERINLKNEACVSPSPHPHSQEAGPCADKARRRRSFGLTGTDPDMSDFPSGERLQEASVHRHYSGLHALPGDPATYLCRHLVVCSLRPDVPCGSITEALVDVAEAQGLSVTKRQGSHVMAEVPADVAGHWEWRLIDMQVGVDRETRDRVLVLRFLMTLPMPSFGSTAAEAEARRRRPATRKFLHGLRVSMQEAALFKHGLCVLSPRAGEGAVSLDPQYMAQIEDMAREEMNATLESAARGLDEYARAAEWRCAQLMSMMQPMFDSYKVDMPTPIKPLPLSAYPMEVVPVVEEVGEEENEGKAGATRRGIGEAAQEEADEDAVEKAEALVRRVWCRLLAQSDAEMTARMQRKNLQVMDRLTKATQFQRRMLQCLRDSRQVLSSPTFLSFQAQTAKTKGLMHDSEAPLYFCSCLVSTRPAVLYCTYWHVVFIARFPGIRRFSWIKAIHLKDITSAQLVSIRLGITLANAISLESRTGSSACGKGGLSDVGTTEGKEEEGQGTETITFTTTTEAARVLDLLRVLIGLHGSKADDMQEYQELSRQATGALKSPRSP